jgi:curli biogenesis system outer membrane secretion channel CsgG
MEGNMKKFLIGLFVMSVFCSSAFAAEKPRIGVMRFTNNTHASWWHGGTGSELQDMLIAELASTEAFSILERKELDKVIGELKLGESGLVDPATKSELGKLKGAKYLIAGTVTSFEHNTSGSNAGVSFMGFNVGGKKETAYLAVDVKLVDVETGEIVESRTIEANSSGGGIKVSGSVMGLSGGLGKEEKTPTGKAIRGCVVHIADYLECRLTKDADDSCRKEYAQKEKKRREKTRKSIDLDE